VSRPEIDPRADVVDLTMALVDVESVSGNERSLTDAVERALAELPHLDVWRHRNTLVARTSLGRSERVVLAGHLDTVPLNRNLPCRRDDEALHGLGACDMKGGVAVMLKIAAGLADPGRDLTFVCYECEEVEAERNGLTLVAAERPELLAADLAVVLEPTNAVIEAGCQGSITVDVVVPGRRAHAARSWNGVNAIHASREVLDRLASYQARLPVIDGLTYHEGLNAVGIEGGVAGNVVPDSCVIRVNHRFAPDRGVDEAEAHLRELFTGFEVSVSDSAPGALPGLGLPAAAAFLQVVGGVANPKFGWTDVARFSAMGIPAVNFGPGDPELAHRQDEYVPIAQLRSCLAQLTDWLG
jgi:succinyl-diaminopimelate desuccinylase